jgi:pimeloyl-ACP methyl ester carboxylesterase
MDLREASQPGATHYCTERVDGLDIFYRVAGAENAPVVLLMHGYPTSSFMFRNLIPLLADTYRVIAPDYPGFGQSSVPNRADFDYTFDGLGDVMETFLDRLGIEQFALYAMDFGAPVGFRLVLKHPERLFALVLQNAPLYPEPPEGWWETLGTYWRDGSDQARAASRLYLSPDSLKNQYLFGVADPSRIDPDTWTLDTALISRPGVDDIMLDLLYDIRRNVPTFAAMRNYLRDHRPPILVATGANDEIFPLSVVRKIVTDLPETEFHALNTGHFALEDHAYDIALLMRDFLSKRLPNPKSKREHQLRGGTSAQRR